MRECLIAQGSSSIGCGTFGKARLRGVVALGTSVDHRFLHFCDVPKLEVLVGRVKSRKRILE